MLVLLLLLCLVCLDCEVVWWFAGSVGSDKGFESKFKAYSINNKSIILCLEDSFISGNLSFSFHMLIIPFLF